jgi:hypothetical protein
LAASKFAADDWKTVVMARRIGMNEEVIVPWWSWTRKVIINEAKTE